MPPAAPWDYRPFPPGTPFAWKPAAPWPAVGPTPGFKFADVVRDAPPPPEPADELIAPPRPIPQDLFGFDAAPARVAPAKAIVWQDDVTAASKLARERRKPLVVVFTQDPCHFCGELLRGPLAGDEVAAMADDAVFVVVRPVDGGDGETLAKGLKVDRYPTITVVDVKGEKIGNVVERGRVVGLFPADELAADLAAIVFPADAIDRAVRERPADAQAFFARAALRMAGGDAAGAIADCTEAVRLDPSKAGAWTVRGQLRRKAGDADAALSDFDRAIAPDPRRDVAYSARAPPSRPSGATPTAPSRTTPARSSSPRGRRKTCSRAAVSSGTPAAATPPAPTSPAASNSTRPTSPRSTRSPPVPKAAGSSTPRRSCRSPRANITPGPAGRAAGKRSAERSRGAANAPREVPLPLARLAFVPKGAGMTDRHPEVPRGISGGEDASPSRDPSGRRAPLGMTCYAFLERLLKSGFRDAG